MDQVVEEVENVKKEFEETYKQTQQHIKSIHEYGKSRLIAQEKSSLPRLNGVAQDGMNILQFKIDLLAPQLPSDDQVGKTKSWHNHGKPTSEDDRVEKVSVFGTILSLRLSLRNANLQAKANMSKAAQEERELLLGAGEESTVRRQNPQTKAGMTSAAESITESLRRTRQLMVQEVERSASTLMTVDDNVHGLDTADESTGVLKKAESEYKGHRSLLTRTRNLLSTMQRTARRSGQLSYDNDFSKITLTFFCNSTTEFIVTLQFAGSYFFLVEIVAGAGRQGANVAQVQMNPVPELNVTLEQAMHDEL
ncbi:hypothetical protein RND71_040137 [Anisodus tanguticus]|uniref:Sec20 C-terminal domain-containing protein n=1 Tax=Anisodus tanguticus TaxID=243964 RepID=A0AAE1UW10_9SOLA|nr:hypothetical protein RND71_040137 [Anisodus tanguticus]